MILKNPIKELDFNIVEELNTLPTKFSDEGKPYVADVIDDMLIATEHAKTLFEYYKSLEQGILDRDAKIDQLNESISRLASKVVSPLPSDHEKEPEIDPIDRLNTNLSNFRFYNDWN